MSGNAATRFTDAATFAATAESSLAGGQELDFSILLLIAAIASNSAWAVGTQKMRFGCEGRYEGWLVPSRVLAAGRRSSYRCSR